MDTVTAIAVVEDGALYACNWRHGFVPVLMVQALRRAHYLRGEMSATTELHVAVMQRESVYAWLRRWPEHPETRGRMVYDAPEDRKSGEEG